MAEAEQSAERIRAAGTLGRRVATALFILFVMVFVTASVAQIFAAAFGWFR